MYRRQINIAVWDSWYKFHIGGGGRICGRSEG